MIELLELQIEACARAAHEANRAYCLSLGDDSQPPWAQAPEWMKESALNGVRGVLKGHSPRDSHENWLKHKKETGWKYGKEKNADKKEHPCFLPYDQLPQEQRSKDYIFVQVVRTLALAFESNAGHVTNAG